MTKALLIIGLVVGLFACSSQPETLSDTHESKGSLFIIGGGSRPDPMVNRMIDEAQVRDQGYVVILPMSSSVPDSAIIWASEQFVRNGVDRVTGFNFELDQTPSRQWLDSLRNAQLIYISGGDQNRFMDIVANTAIEEAINEAYDNGSMIAGTSAGAAVMSHKMITGNELKRPDYSETFRTIESENIELGRGLGFITSGIVDQHFVWRSRHNRLLSAIIEHPDMKGYGVDESTAMLVKGNDVEVVGVAQVMVFSNPDASSFEKDGKLGARNLRIEIYLPGDTFSLK